MKRSSLMLMFITAVFTSFLVGILVGRNIDRGQPAMSGADLSLSTSASSPDTTASWSEEPTQEPQQSFPININTATAEELMALPGIGEVLAGRIVSYRIAHGEFSSVDELLQVDGIGEKTMEKILGLITVG